MSEDKKAEGAPVDNNAEAPKDKDAEKTSADNNGNGVLPKSKRLSNGLLIAGGLILVIILFGLYSSDGEFLVQLKNTDVSRGLITFLVAIVTVSISLLLVIWVLASQLSDENLTTRFTSAKEVLTTLVGILGTILGFYFGSAERIGAVDVSLSDIRLINGEATVHANGGTPPYRFTTNIVQEGKNGNDVTEDGWFSIQIPNSFEAGNLITIEVRDSKDETASKSRNYETK